MGAVLVPVILVAVVVVLGIIATKRFSRAEARHSDRLQNADRPTLRYQVAPGQDHAAVLTDLRHAGYDVSPDSEPGPSSPVLIIGTPSGAAPDREELRALLARSSVNVDPGAEVSIDRPPVRFMDEV
jgi:hypothetical protein